MSHKALLAALCVLAGVSGPAGAAITIHTTSAGFATATADAAVDDFDDLDYLNPSYPRVSQIARAYSYSASAPAGTFGAGSPGDVWLSANDPSEAITFALGGMTPVSAIGGNFFGSDYNGNYAAGGVTLTVTDADGTVSFTIANPSVTSFVGFTSNKQITQMTLSAAGTSGDVFATANNLTLARSVPESGTWAMMLSGFLLLGMTLRRRQRVAPTAN